MAQRHGGSCALRPPHRLQRCQAHLCVQVGSAATEQHGQVGLERLGPQLVHYAGRVPDEWWGSQGRTSSGEFTFSSQLAAAKLGGALILTGAGMPLAAEALAFQPQLKPLPRQPADCCYGNVPAFAK